jgi:adenosyl cobinamide kinase/adenosyl cobinamide phosphate guanylyltransferase
MILIFGGAYQGKTAYAEEHFSGRAIVNNFDRLVLDWIQADECVESNLQRFADENVDAVVICNDISCGVVPIDPVMRRWREEVGRAMGMLSQRSDAVIRLFCGIPTKLK